MTADLDVVGYFVARQQRLVGGQRRLVAQSLQAAAPRQPSTRHQRSSALLYTFVADARVRNDYSLEQALLPISKADRITAKCRQGIVELPSIGHLRLYGDAKPDSVLVDLEPRCRIRSPSVRARFFPSTKTRAGVELINHVPLAFRQLFWGGDARVTVSSPSRLRACLESTIARLAQVGVLELVTRVTNSVLFFRGGAKNSFYDSRAHGALFVRFGSSHDELHLLEEIVHQAGHAALTILLLETNSLLRAGKHQRTQRLSSATSDTRSVLVAFHGLVTEALVAETLGRTYGIATSRSERHQLVGRLAFATRKLAGDLRLFADRAKLLGAEGRLLLGAITNTCRKVVLRYGDVLERVTLTGQPYVFSRARYLAANPYPFD